MPIENDDTTIAMLQAIDRSMIIILIAHLSKSTKDPIRTIDNVLVSIKETLMEGFKRQSPDQEGSFIFNSLADSAKPDYEKRVDEVIAKYKEPIMDILTYSKPVKDKK
jgi:hypothetical protein